MKRKSMLAILVGIMVLFSVTSHAQNKKIFTLYNLTGYTIIGIYVSPVHSDTWGGNWIAGRYLSSGKYIELDFSTLTSDFVDIRMVDTDGDTYTARKLNTKQMPALGATILLLD